MFSPPPGCEYKWNSKHVFMNIFQIHGCNDGLKSGKMAKLCFVACCTFQKLFLTHNSCHYWFDVPIWMQVMFERLNFMGNNGFASHLHWLHLKIMFGTFDSNPCTHKERKLFHAIFIILILSVRNEFYVRKLTVYGNIANKFHFECFTMYDLNLWFKKAQRPADISQFQGWRSILI